MIQKLRTFFFLIASCMVGVLPASNAGVSMSIHVDTSTLSQKTNVLVPQAHHDHLEGITSFLGAEDRLEASEEDDIRPHFLEIFSGFLVLQVLGNFQRDPQLSSLSWVPQPRWRHSRRQDTFARIHSALSPPVFVSL